MTERCTAIDGNGRLPGATIDANLPKVFTAKGDLTGAIEKTTAGAGHAEPDLRTRRSP
jgi:hypothetical protein